MAIKVFGNTDVGLKREKNEDSLLSDPKINLFIVADGMGGHKGGEVASRLAAETMNEIVNYHLENSSFFSPKAVIEEGYRQANERIFKKSHSDFELQGMGTTMVTLFFYKDTLYVGNVGDSRAYLMREKYIWQITEDHSVLNEHLRAGLIRDSEVKNFQAKNFITRSVGFEQEVVCDVFERKFNVGDRYLICSDGLCGLITDELMLEICHNSKSEDAVANCIDAAKRHGGDDNITTLIVDVV